MLILKSINLSRLSNNASYSFHKRELELLTPMPHETLAVLIEKYSVNFEILKKLNQDAVESSAAATASEADALRDKAWSGALGYVRHLTNYAPDSTIQEAASQIYNVMRMAGSDVPRLPKAEESAAIEGSIDGIDALGATIIEACHFKIWLEALRKAEEAYEKAERESINEKSRKTLGEMKAAREACDETFNAIAKKINALIEIEGESAFAEIVATMNVIIDESKVSNKKSAKETLPSEDEGVKE